MHDVRCRRLTSGSQEEERDCRQEDFIGKGLGRGEERKSNINPSWREKEGIREGTNQ